MNEERIQVEDNNFKNLWYLVNYVKGKHFSTGNANSITIVTKHKEHVDDIISEITEALDNYKRWISGKNKLPQILRLRLIIAKYRDEVFPEIRTRPARAIQNYNNNKDRFQAITTDILKLYRND